MSAEPVESGAQPPRIWPAVTALLGAVPFAILLQSVTLLAVVAARSARTGETGDAIAWLEQFVQTPQGLLVVLLPSQAAFWILALTGAGLSPTPARERLGLRPHGLGAIDWVLLAGATFFVHRLGAAGTVTLFDQPSEALIGFTKPFLTASLPWAVVLVLAASVLPGFGEEMLCRGFVQDRLLRRWPPLLAITFTSIAFALFHIDSQHVLGVVPLSFWLGFVAWRAGSIWPTIFCHAFVNMVALTLTVAFETLEGVQAPYRLEPLHLVLLGVSAPFFVLAFLRLMRRRPPELAAPARTGSPGA